MFNLKNQTERDFYDYMMSRRTHKESTVRHYINKLRKIRSLDVLVTENTDLHISAYETGIYKSVNEKSHKDYSSALKRFKEFKLHKGIA